MTCGENAQAKLAAKGIDLLVANDVSRKGIGFEADDNQVVLLDRWGGEVELPDDVQARRRRRHPRSRARAPRRRGRPSPQPARLTEKGRRWATGKSSPMRCATWRARSATTATSASPRSPERRRRAAASDRRREGARRPGGRAAGLHPLQALPEPDQLSPSARAIRAPGSWWWAKGRARRKTSRASPSWAAPASSSPRCSSRWASTESATLHRQRGEVPAGAESQSGAGRGGGLQSLPHGAARHRAARA